MIHIYLSKYNVQCCTIHVMATVHNGVQCWSHLNHNSNINGKKKTDLSKILILTTGPALSCLRTGVLIIYKLTFHLALKSVALRVTSVVKELSLQALGRPAWPLQMNCCPHGPRGQSSNLPVCILDSINVFPL